MASQRIKAFAHARAPQDVVWSVVADARGWSRWGQWSDARLQEEEIPAPDGVGALRAFTRRPVVSRERVTVFEPPEHLCYELLSGLPLRDYRAEILLSSNGDGTDISWRSEFDPKIPGTGGIFRRQLQRFITDTAERLAREAERLAGRAER